MVTKFKEIIKIFTKLRRLWEPPKNNNTWNNDNLTILSQTIYSSRLSKESGPTKTSRFAGFLVEKFSLPVYLRNFLFFSLFTRFCLCQFINLRNFHFFSLFTRFPLYQLLIYEISTFFSLFTRFSLYQFINLRNFHFF